MSYQTIDLTDCLLFFIDLEQALDTVQKEMVQLRETLQKNEKKLQVTQTELETSKGSLKQSNDKVTQSSVWAAQ